MAKFSAPRIQGAVPRERLFSWLDKEAQRPLIWLNGPPGAGKTTVIGSYFERSPHNVVWYRADSGDLDLATIFHNLREAALAVAPKAASHLFPLTPEYMLDVATFARNFFRTLFSFLEPPAAIVFDNFHDAAEGALDAVLKVAVAESTKTTRLFAISRNGPPPTLVSLEVHGQIAVLAWDDLRLTLKEAGAIAAATQVSDASLVRAQLALCDGWVAGFALLLGHAKRFGPLDSTGTARSRAALFNYFSSELFTRAPPQAQHVLLCTALLPDFTMTQAGGFVDPDEAEQRVQWLYERNFFIDCREGATPIYRYHDLFRDFLLERGRTIFQPQQRRALLRQAADIAERSGQPETALGLVLEATAWEEAARLICSLAPSLLEQGRSIPLDRWIGALPSTLLDSVPWLGYWQGLARLTSDPGSGRQALQRAHANFAAQGNAIACLLCCAGILHSFYLEWGDQRALDPWLEEFRRLVHTAGCELPPGMESQIVPCVLAFLMRHPGDALLDWAVGRARWLADRTTDPVQQAQLLLFVITQGIVRGQWQEGVRLLAQLDRVLTPAMPPLLQLSCCAAKIAWSSMSVEYASEATGRAQIRRFIDLSESSGVHVLDVFGLGQGIYFALNWRDLGLAAELVGRMRRVLNPQRIVDVVQFSWSSAAVAMEQGDLVGAAAHMNTGMDAVLASGANLGLATNRVLLAQILMLQGNAPAALREVNFAMEYASAVKSVPLEHTGLLVKAYVLLSCGEVSQGLEALRAGLALGRNMGQGIMVPTAHAEMTRYLYSVALREGIEVDHVRRLVRRFRIEPASIEVAEWPWRIRIFTLGRFSILKDDVAIQTSSKRQRKPLELLLALIALGGRAVSSAALMKQVWPAQGAGARPSFDVALMRLRRLLAPDALVLDRGRLTLNNQICWVDAWAFERAVTQDLSDKTPAEQERLFETYRGRFLPDETGIPCVTTMRERLAMKFQRIVLAAGNKHEREARFERAADLYRTGLEHDNLVEEFHRRLIYCEWKLGHHAEAIKSYHRCRSLLSVNLNTEPSHETRALYQRAVAESSS